MQWLVLDILQARYPVMASSAGRSHPQITDKSRDRHFLDHGIREIICDERIQVALIRDWMTCRYNSDRLSSLELLHPDIHPW